MAAARVPMITATEQGSFLQPRPTSLEQRLLLQLMNVRSPPTSLHELLMQDRSFHVIPISRGPLLS